MPHILFHVLAVPLLFFSNVIASDDQDPFDLSFYTKGAAIGDSYAAGIGAGNELAFFCSRYDGSYANLVAIQLGVEPEKFDFTYTACSGALVQDVHKQAEKLSSGQEFVIVSAGGNDALLGSILNSCVYSFYGFFSHPPCDKKLDDALAIIQSDGFTSSLDNLLKVVKSKLTPTGNVYYTGYAQFFDTTDNTCDKVSWHIWLNIGTKEWLTQNRRRRMNDLVLEMNKALRATVERAGSNVHFIDYDDVVQSTYGTFCQPGRDESNGKSANRHELFFYEMRSRDTPMLEGPPKYPHNDRKLKHRRDGEDDIKPANGTLRELYGAMIQDAIEESIDDGDDEYAALYDDNANFDLQEEVDDEIEDQVAATEGDIVTTSIDHDGPQLMEEPKPPLKFTFAKGRMSKVAPSQNVHALGSKVSFGSDISAASFTTQQHTLFPSGTPSWNSSQITDHFNPNDTAIGTVVANTTHIMLDGGQPVMRQSLNLKKLIVPDSAFRVFHPTQAGHAMIANLVLFQMAQDNAKRLGLEDTMPPLYANTAGEGWPKTPGAACNMDSTSTWSDRDAMRSALTEFCSDVDNVHGSKGQLTSGTYNSGLDYMNISIQWDSDNGVISEHGCMSWLDVVMDGCDVPKEGRSNLKHGGTIDSIYPTVDATLRIEPLVMRRIWDGDRSESKECNDIDTDHYVDQGTLESNIDAFCTESAKQEVAESGSVFSQTFNDGTPNRVVLTTEWPKGPRNYQVFWEECQYYMGVLNNGCSPAATLNKMNWKHGGTISDNNGVKYTVEPTQARPPPPEAPFGNCKATWTPFYYAVTVKGAGSLHADWGAKLLREFKNCGETTAWTFKYYDVPAEEGTEWEAYGQIPILIASHCAKRAVRRAAGFDNKGQC